MNFSFKAVDSVDFPFQADNWKALTIYRRISLWIISEQTLSTGHMGEQRTNAEEQWTMTVTVNRFILQSEVGIATW